MEGLILNEDSEYVTYMPPIFEAIGYDVIAKYNWRLSYVECFGSFDATFPYENILDTWVKGVELVKQVRNNPKAQWVWGLLQGFSADIPYEKIKDHDINELDDDTRIWEYPVFMRDSLAEIEIEAFDSTMSIVVAKDIEIIKKLKASFSNAEVLSEYNKNLC